LLRQLRHFVSSILGIATAVVKKVADVMRFEYIDQALIVRTMLLQGFEFVTTGAKRAGRCMNKPCERSFRFLADINQVFGKRANNSITTCVNIPDFFRIKFCGINHAGGGGIDNGGNSTGLGIKSVVTHGISSNKTVLAALKGAGLLLDCR